MLNKILSAALLMVCAVPAAGAAQERPIRLESDVKLVQAAPQGEAPKLVAAESVVPGDTLVFTTSYRNEGSSAVNDFVIVNPVPNDLVLTDEAAAQNEVSVDGGKNWGRLSELTVAGDDGKVRPAGIDDVTHMRWIFARVAPSEKGEVKFSARVR